MTSEYSIGGVHHPDVESDPSKASPIVIPGPAEEVAQKIGSVSPEGVPADPKIGPAGLHWLVVLAGLVIVLVSLGMGLLVDPAAGFAMLGIGGLAFLFSPGFLVAFARAHEREEVAKTMSDRVESHREVIRVKDPSKPRSA
jgi:hypothetical protein